MKATAWKPTLGRREPTPVFKTAGLLPPRTMIGQMLSHFKITARLGASLGIPAKILSACLLLGCWGSEPTFEGIRRFPVGNAQPTRVHRVNRWASEFQLGGTVRVSLILPRSACATVPWALQTQHVSARVEIDLLDADDRHPVLRRTLSQEEVLGWQEEHLDLGEFGPGPVQIEIRVSAEGPPQQEIGPIVIASIEVWSGAAKRIPDTLPDVVLIAVDTLRADHLSTYGAKRPTPYIDALADSGTVFESAFSPSTWTLPSFASVFTSTYPLRHQVTTSKWRLPADLPTLGDVFARQGYRTIGLFDGGWFHPRFGFGRGFDVFIDGKGIGDAEQRLTPRLETATHAPLLLLFHTYDIHQPYYSAPRNYRNLYTSRRYRSPLQLRRKRIPSKSGRATVELSEEDLELVRALYDGEIRYLDDSLPVIFDLLDSHRPGRPRLVVLFSDHGESFGEEGRLLHSSGPYRELSHVPLIIAGDGIPAGRRVRRVVETLGLLPTLIELLDFADEGTGGFDGSSFAELLGAEPRTEPPRAYALAQRDGWALRSDHWSLVVDRRGAHLYDRRNDPREIVDVAARHPGVVARLTTSYNDLMGNIQEETPGEVTLDAKALDDLRALGYLD